jgi:cytochrome P450
MDADSRTQAVPAIPPGRDRPARPPWRDFGLIRRNFSRDILAGLQFMHRTYGPFVRTRLPMQLYFVSEPAVIDEILVKKADSFRKDRTSRLLGRVVGNGLLVNEGEPWRRQRRLMQPAFHQRHLQTYADLMVGAVERAAAGWQADQLRNVHDDMMAVTMAIVAEALFGTEVGGHANQVGGAIAAMMEEFGRILGLAARFQPPAWVPTRANRRFRASARQIDGLIQRIIDQRKQNPAQREDLLSLLIQARDEDGAGMSDTQIRDEAMTLFLAGHETTALALTYALFLLAQHPADQARVADEVARVLGNRRATFDDVGALTETEWVVLETMRLYPPAWALGRQALAEVEVGGFRFPRGAEFVMSPWVVHRDPKLFPDPDRFDPQRWRDNLQQRLPRFAYFPFGGGPRVCIGNRFAMMEAKLVLATLLQRFRVAPGPETQLALAPSVTLRPRGGVQLRLVAPG